MKIELNPQQHQAVATTEGYVLVLAGAGSGKTRVLTERIAYLVREKGVSPDRILAFTFTNKAAGEMRARVERALAMRRLPFWIGTFHATGLKILRREAQHIGISRNFAVFDEDDSLSLLRDMIRKKGWKLDEYPPAAARSRISRWKNALVLPQEALEKATDALEERHAEIYRGYIAGLARCNALDFDDLIARVVELFGAHPKVRQRYARQFRYVLVDEFQDTNTIQMVMIDALASAHGNLFVVGDDDQAIYGWRGATIENILQFERVYRGTTVIRLEENYRSTETILEASNAVIAGNAGRTGKRLWSRLGAGAPVRVYHAADEREEAVAARETLIGLIRRGFARGEIAVLYRTHAQSRAIEAAMLTGGLPYQIIGGVRFYERREIKDLLGYLKLISNPADDVSFRRIINVPRRGIGGVTLERLEAAAGGDNLLAVTRRREAPANVGAAQRERLAAFSQLIASLGLIARTGTAHEVLSAVIERTGYRDFLREDPHSARDRLENVQELLNETIRFSSDAAEPTLAQFLEEIALLSDVDLMGGGEKVSLMTLHNSKGLEFRAVLITGMEEGLLPHYSAQDDQRELEEERRLFYVGMTRAKEELYLFCAAGRLHFGNWSGNRPSRFLGEIPARLREVTGGASFGRAAEGLRGTPVRTRDREVGDSVPVRAASRLRVGAVVHHPTFGEGLIRALEGSGENLKVSVQFAGHGTKKFLARYAPFRFGK